jgi:hypothetical protein
MQFFNTSQIIQNIRRVIDNIDQSPIAAHESFDTHGKQMYEELNNHLNQNRNINKIIIINQGTHYQMRLYTSDKQETIITYRANASGKEQMQNAITNSNFNHAPKASVDIMGAFNQIHSRQSNMQTFLRE